MSVRRVAGRCGGTVTAVLIGECANAEDASEERPAERDVGDEDSGGELTDVPVEEDWAIGNGKVVVSVKNCGEDHEDTQAEDTAED
jgi:hypothetical protein